MTEDCIFCKILTGDVPGEKIYENDAFFSVYDIHPDVPGHALVIPKHHSQTILDMPATGGTELLECIKHTALIVLEKVGASDFKIVQNNGSAAGQAVFHVHFHILPQQKS